MMAGDWRQARALVAHFVVVLGCAWPVSARAWQTALADGARVSVDATLRQSLDFRLVPANAAYFADINADDGDRAFDPGLVSARLSARAGVSVDQGDAGLRISADGWYDPVYHARTANRSAATFNPLSVSPDSFTAATRRQEGADIELGDANVHDRFDLAGRSLTLRIGRQNIIWGESLFFAENGIAAGQAPIDSNAAARERLAYSKDFFLPVGQASADWRLTDTIDVTAYWQFEWRRDRMPAVGSYFSTNDTLDVGGERVLYGPYYAIRRGADRTPGAPDQGGVAFRYTTDQINLGFYALRYDAKSPTLVISYPGYKQAPFYYADYPTGIDLYGASLGFYAGDTSIGAEISLRQHMPLVTYGAGIARGTTLHGVLSATATLPPNRFWDGALLQGEFSANKRLLVDSGAAFLDPYRSQFAAGMRAVFTPQYFQVLPGLDMTVPIGIGSGLGGSSSIDAEQYGGGGDITVGVSGVYHAVWTASLLGTYFFGGAYNQPLGDRHFVSVTLSRSF